MATIQLKENIKNCYLRGGPLQVKELQTRAPAEKWIRHVKPGEKFEIVREVKRKGEFVQFEFKESVEGEKFWWVYRPFWSVPGAEVKKMPTVGGDGLPTSVKLSMPYLSQLDNENVPHGTCNLTSIASCMVFYGHPRFDSTGRQLEDQLFELCERKGLDRHNHWHLKEIITGFGYKDNYQEDAKWGDVKRHLAGGNPCICAGFFSRSGHILVLSGYNETGFIVSDPYGVWYYQEDGRHYYDTTAPGDGITYPYEELVAVCGPDKDLWIHFISR